MTVKNVAINNDIIHPRWIIECAVAKTLIPLSREWVAIGSLACKKPKLPFPQILCSLDVSH